MRQPLGRRYHGSRAFVDSPTVRRCGRLPLHSHPRHKEPTMHHRQRLTLTILGLVCLLGVSRSWGGPPNNDVSDARGNTAGGTGALVSNTTGHGNTAFGVDALVSNTTGANN